MTGKIFISCGQEDENERRVASEVVETLIQLGFKSPYVAIQSQSLQDVNSGIFAELMNSDYYLFIDFAREELSGHGCNKRYRGSLFTNQELAIAHMSGFEHAIFFQQRNVCLEGIATFVLANATKFDDPNDLARLVSDAVKARDWSPNYSRHLLGSDVNRTLGPITYNSFGNTRYDFVFYATIKNQRADVAARNTIGRLITITDDTGAQHPIHDKSRLHWGGQSGFECTIFPSDSESLSLIAIDRDMPRHAFLHSARDIPPQHPTLNLPGKYILRYQLVADGFPLHKFDVEFKLTGDIQTTSVKILT